MTADIGFLRDLVVAPGPSGFEQPVQEVVRRRVARPSPRPRPTCSATSPLRSIRAPRRTSSWPPMPTRSACRSPGSTSTGSSTSTSSAASIRCCCPGARSSSTPRRGPVDGVVGKRPTHLIPEAERGKAADICDQWIDIGAPDRAAALARVGCGDPITFSPHFVELAGGFVAGRGARRPLRRLRRRARPRALRRRARRRRAHRALDRPGGDALHGRAGPGAPPAARLHDRRRRRLRHRPARSRAAARAAARSSLGGGPALGRGGCSNPRLSALFEEVAAAEGIAVQVKAYPGDTQTDNEFLQTAGAGTAAINVGLPDALHALAARGRAPRRPRGDGAARGGRRASPRRGLRARLLHAAGLSGAAPVSRVGSRWRRGAAQDAVKLFVSIDLEGCTGVVAEEQTEPGRPA